MKYCLMLIISMLFIVGLNAQSKDYDKALADSLGSDEYGMKAFVLVILKTGTNQEASKEVRDSLFRGHMANINRLVTDKKLIVAGPLGKNDKTYRGIFILDVKTVEEAAALVQTDPAVKAKIFDVELFPWYGSAALPMYLKYVDKVTKKSF